MTDQDELFLSQDQILASKVELTDLDSEIFKNFDYSFEGSISFKVPELPDLPEKFNIGVICGSSGSGKSSILKNLGKEEELTWDDNKTIASHFDSVDDAIDRLSAVGLNSIPTWSKPRHVLSNGEGFRADLARRLKSNCVIDEFTSVVNRDVAKSCSTAFSKYIKRNNLTNIILATCHEDIIEWLSPDWVFYTDTQTVSRRSLQRPRIEINIHECSKDYWSMFAHHHYLTSEIPPIVDCYLATWNGVIVGFASSICLPGKSPPLYEGDTRIKYRECRTVVLPDFQGLGIGTRLSDAVGDIVLEKGYRYFSKTAHIRMGEYRQRSSKWRATQTNLMDRGKSTKRSKNNGTPYDQGLNLIPLDTTRICYSHEYIGADRKSYDPKWLEVRKSLQVTFDF